MTQIVNPAQDLADDLLSIAETRITDGQVDEHAAALAALKASLVLYVRSHQRALQSYYQTEPSEQDDPPRLEIEGYICTLRLYLGDLMKELRASQENNQNLQ